MLRSDHLRLRLEDSRLGPADCARSASLAGRWKPRPRVRLRSATALETAEPGHEAGRADHDPKTRPDYRSEPERTVRRPGPATPAWSPRRSTESCKEHRRTLPCRPGAGPLF